MSKPLAGRTAVVTGGGRGIGSAIARRLVGLGAQCVITGRNPQRLQKAAAEISKAGPCEAIVCDVTNYASVESLAAQVQKKFGGLKILVNNAGIGGFGRPLHTMPVEDWDPLL